MTATDLHAQALALIAERRGLVAAGTSGPWEENAYADGSVMIDRISEDDDDAGSEIATLASTADAALIVTMRNDYGPLLDLGEHTFTMHAPDVDGYCLGRHYLYEGALLWSKCPDATAALRSLGLVTT